MGKQKWYGGKIQQVARLSEAENGSFQLTLTKMESRKSNRFARFLSSRRLLQVSIGKKLVNDRKEDVDAFFKQKFVLCGRVFVALGAKDNKAFLMETPEDYERTTTVPGDDKRITLDEFVAWHNPPEENGRQVSTLWDCSNLPYPISLAYNKMGDSLRSGVLNFSASARVFR